MVSKAFKTQREFIVITSRCAKPSAAELNELLQPTSRVIQEMQSFRESNRPSKLFNHLSAVSESIPALGWIAVVSVHFP